VYDSYTDRIREDEYLLMHQYCVKDKPQILTAAEKLGSTAAEILVEGFNVHGMSVAEFLQEKENLLTLHFKGYCRVSAQRGDPQTSSLETSGPEQPTEVALSLQPFKSGTIPVEGAMVAPRRATYEPRATEPADILFRESPSHGIIQSLPLVNQNLGDGRTLQAQWQQYADPAWTQHLPGSELPLDNAFNLPQNHLGQVDAAIRQGSGEFYPEVWLDDLTRAGGFGT
jgi:hypothetical protein